MCSLTMKHTRVVSTKCTPGFACRAFSDTTLVCFIVNEHTTKCSRYMATNNENTKPGRNAPVTWRAFPCLDWKLFYMALLGAWLNYCLLKEMCHQHQFPKETYMVYVPSFMLSSLHSLGKLVLNNTKHIISISIVRFIITSNVEHVAGPVKCN